MTLVVCIKGLA